MTLPKLGSRSDALALLRQKKILVGKEKRHNFNCCLRILSGHLQQGARERERETARGYFCSSLHFWGWDGARLIKGAGRTGAVVAAAPVAQMVQGQHGGRQCPIQKTFLVYPQHRKI